MRDTNFQKPQRVRLWTLSNTENNILETMIAQTRFATDTDTSILDKKPIYFKLHSQHGLENWKRYAQVLGPFGSNIQAGGKYILSLEPIKLRALQFVFHFLERTPLAYKPGAGMAFENRWPNITTYQLKYRGLVDTLFYNCIRAVLYCPYFSFGRPLDCSPYISHLLNLSFPLDTFVSNSNLCVSVKSIASLWFLSGFFRYILNLESSILFSCLVSIPMQQLFKCYFKLALCILRLYKDISHSMFW